MAVEVPPDQSDTFADLARDALLHLYDAAYLQTHPLARFVGPPDGKGAALRGKLLLQALLDAVDGLRPTGGASDDPRAWRVYRLLECRYIEGLSVAEVLGQLAVSKTQYQRDHARALQAVASLLRDRWRGEGGAPPRQEQPQSRELLALAEADRVAAELSPEDFDLGDALAGLISLLQPIADEEGIRLSLSVEPDLPPAHCDRVALRHALLGFLSAAMEEAAGGTVEVRAALAGEALTMAIRAAPGPAAPAPRRPAGASGPEIEVGRRLVAALGGRVEVGRAPAGGGWAGLIELPVARCPVVLVMDNHPDFVALVRRYLAEHSWRVVGARDVGQARSLARELGPDAVLMDVMMPGEDGWDLLLALRSHPETGRIPVIVCSVLYEPQVARALGAVGYLPKPISQAALLDALAPYRQPRRADRRGEGGPSPSPALPR